MILQKPSFQSPRSAFGFVEWLTPQWSRFCRPFISQGWEVFGVFRISGNPDECARQSLVPGHFHEFLSSFFLAMYFEPMTSFLSLLLMERQGIAIGASIRDRNTFLIPGGVIAGQR